MTNKEIDIKLKWLADAIPQVIQARPHGIERELEALNMSLMAVWAMLGEIAKRLPPEMKEDQGSH